jgi:hypothetical protein
MSLRSFDNTRQGNIFSKTHCQKYGGGGSIQSPLPVQIVKSLFKIMAFSVKTKEEILHKWATLGGVSKTEG